MPRLIGFVFVACLIAQASFAADSDKVVGTRKLVSYEVEVQATGQKLPVMGEKPTGYATFTQEGRVFFVLTGEARKAAKTDQERAELLSTLVACTAPTVSKGASGRPMSRWPGTPSGLAPSRFGISSWTVNG